MQLILTWLAILLLLAGCTSVEFGRPYPYIVFHTGDNIEITQSFATGVGGFNEAEGMALLTRECGGAFRIERRTKTADGHVFVDAVCTH